MRGSIEIGPGQFNWAWIRQQAESGPYDCLPELLLSEVERESFTTNPGEICLFCQGAFLGPGAGA